MGEDFDKAREVVIDYERQSTWPHELTELFDSSANVLADPGERDQIVEKANEVLAGENLLGFHCARLADDELSDIQTSGLRPLNSDFLQERIKLVIYLTCCAVAP